MDLHRRPRTFLRLCLPFEAEHCPFMLMLQATKRLSLHSRLPDLRKGLFTTGLLAVPCVGGGTARLKKGLST